MGVKVIQQHPTNYSSKYTLGPILFTNSGCHDASLVAPSSDTQLYNISAAHGAQKWKGEPIAALFLLQAQMVLTKNRDLTSTANKKTTI